MTEITLFPNMAGMFVFNISIVVYLIHVLFRFHLIIRWSTEHDLDCSYGSGYYTKCIPNNDISRKYICHDTNNINQKSINDKKKVESINDMDVKVDDEHKMDKLLLFGKGKQNKHKNKKRNASTKKINHLRGGK